MKRINVALGLAVLSLLIGGQASAAELLAPADKQHPNLTLSSSEQHRNLYVAAGNLTINSNILGDLYAVGGMVNVTGTVEQDLDVAGGNLNVGGAVGGDARIAGGNIVINSAIKGDLLVAGGNISISEKAFVGGDLVSAGGNILIDSPITGNVRIMGGNITINSKVGGDVNITAGRKLTFGAHSEVLGKITYRGKDPAEVEPGAKISSIDFKRITHPTFDTRKLFVLYGVMGIISLLAWIAAGLLLAGFLRGRVHTIINHAYNKPWQNMGTGLIAVIVAPVLIVLLFITVVGYYVALILAAVYGLMVLLSMLLSAIFLGAWIMKYADKNFIFNQKWWQAVIVGAVALKILSWIPFLGWLAACLLFLTLLGALLRIFKEDIVRMR